MKVYVDGFGPKDSQKPLNTRLTVAYSASPERTWGSLLHANSDCEYLNRHRIHVGQHLCYFSVEELPSGDFSIVCLTHPEGPAH